jgi:putative hydrolase of the HAD superfamily
VVIGIFTISLKDGSNLMSNWLLIDYDDTLGGVLVDGKVCNNDVAYTDTIKVFNGTMSMLGFPLQESVELQKEVDQSMCRTFGFAHRERFAESLVRTYKALATRHETPIDALMEDSILRLGNQVFEYRYMPLPGALKTLHALQENYRVAIVTKGEVHEQWKKIKDSGVSNFVDRVFPVGFKHQEDWLGVLTALEIPPQEYKNIWAIGNAPKSDVNVPLTLGLNAIHVDQGGWLFEKEDYADPMEGRQLIVVDTIDEILDHLQWS